MAQRHVPLLRLEPRRVCLIKPSALGDVVQTLPILSMLRSRWPAASFVWVIKSSLAGLLEGHPDLESTIVFDRSSRGIAAAGAQWRLMRDLRRGDFDLAIDLQGLLRSGLMTLATAAPRRVGFASAREGAPWAYTDQVKLSAPDLPALERYRQVAAALGCTGQPPAARLGISEADRRWVRARLAGLPRPWLAIHPGAGWLTKRWPGERFAALAARARQEFGASIVLLGEKNDSDAGRTIAAGVGDCAVDLCAQTSLLQLAAVCKAADVFLSGDTGPMHLAAAVGTRVVSVFTCTSPLRAGPRDQEQRAVLTNVPCAASYLKRCASLACMQELLPIRVWPVLRQALAEAAADRENVVRGPANVLRADAARIVG
jgi:lipopolysaccharide heptosyltransferase I